MTPLDTCARKQHRPSPLIVRSADMIRGFGGWVTRWQLGGDYGTTCYKGLMWRVSIGIVVRLSEGGEGEMASTGLGVGLVFGVIRC